MDIRNRRSKAVGRLAAFTVAAAATACAGGFQPAGTSAPSPRGGYDLIIEGGRIVDGTGAAWFYGDLGVVGDRIARVAPAGVLSGARARNRIDATGLVVAPGFIDIQSHSRFAALQGDGRLVSKVTQGVTTEIMGEGTTNAPVNDQIVGASGASPGSVEEQRLRRFEGPRGFDAWLRAMEANGVSTNVGSFVGAGTLRVYGRGLTMGRASTAQLHRMQEAVRHAMEDGAFGIASALIYPPGNFADTRELIGLAEAMAPYGGIYVTHMRSEADQVLEAMDEAIEIGEEAGVPVEIYHLKAAGQRNWDKQQAMIAKIDSARAEGLDVQANMYPYVAGGTGLTACFPPWVSAEGQLLSNLGNPDVRARIRQEIEADEGQWENLCVLSSPEGVLILGLEREGNRGLVGRRLSEIADMTGTDWVDAAMDLVLSEEQRVGTIYFMMNEDNVRTLLQQPWMKFGTDASGADPETATGLVHPRSYGTYTRILGRYVREEGVISLEDAIRKMTSAVATRLQIRDRGVLKEGMFADITVFDPELVIDHATFEDPHQLSEGVEYVFVNGVAVLSGGVHTGATPGTVVRGPGWTGWR